MKPTLATLILGATLSLPGMSAAPLFAQERHPWDDRDGGYDRGDDRDRGYDRGSETGYNRSERFADRLADAVGDLRTAAAAELRHWDPRSQSRLDRIDRLLRVTEAYRRDADDPRAREESYRAVAQAWSQVHDSLEGLRVGSALIEPIARIERLMDRIADNPRGGGPWRPDADVVIPAGTRIPVVLRQQTCASDMPLNSTEDVRMWLADDLVVNGRVLARSGDPVGVGARGNNRRLVLQLSGVRFGNRFYPVTSQNLSFIARGRGTWTFADERPLAQVKGSYRRNVEVCLPDGYRMDFVTDRPVELSGRSRDSFPRT